MVTRRIELTHTRVLNPSNMKHGEEIVIVANTSQRIQFTTGTIDGFPWISEENGSLMVRLRHKDHRRPRISDFSLDDAVVYYLPK